MPLTRTGMLWVANWGKGTIAEFSSSGAFMHSYGSYGTGSGQFRNPIGIAVNQSTGNVYVGDYGNNRIDELNEKGEYVAGFGYGVGNHEEKFEACTSSCVGGNPGSGAGQFSSLEGVAVDSKGDVWAADSGNNRVEEFSSSNAFLLALGYGVTNGEEKLRGLYERLSRGDCRLWQWAAQRCRGSRLFWSQHVCG